ncbi:hypothetical protein IWQ62_006766, partial [Dispira parvispora]
IRSLLTPSICPIPLLWKVVTKMLMIWTRLPCVITCISMLTLATVEMVGHVLLHHQSQIRLCLPRPEEIRFLHDFDNVRLFLWIPNWLN